MYIKRTKGQIAHFFFPTSLGGDKDWFIFHQRLLFLSVSSSICFATHGRSQFSLISISLCQILPPGSRSSSAFTRMRDVRGERGTPLVPDRRNRASGQREEFPLTDWMLEEQPGNLRSPPWNNGNVLIFKKKVFYFHAALPLVTQTLAQSLPPRTTTHFLPPKHVEAYMTHRELTQTSCLEVRRWLTW